MTPIANRSVGYGPWHGTRHADLRASQVVRPGNRPVFISIFDRGDRLFDSSVFIDRFRVDDRKPCTGGTARM